MIFVIGQAFVNLRSGDVWKTADYIIDPGSIDNKPHDIVYANPRET